MAVGRNDETPTDLERRVREGHRRSATSKAMGQSTSASTGSFCLHCSAWRGSLGLEPTPELYVDHVVEVFREVRRVLRNDGTLWLNLGDSYASQPSWGRGNNKRGGGGEPYQAGVTRDLTGLKPKDLCGIPWRVAFALQADGWWLRSDIIWHKTNPMPESVQDRPTKSHEYLFLLSKKARYYYDAEAIKEDAKPEYAARYKSAMYAGNKESSGGGRPDNAANTPGMKAYTGKRNKRTVWTLPTQPFKGAHFATFPEKLVEPCIKAGTSERGCCPSCGKPWERVVEKGKVTAKGGKGKHFFAVRGDSRKGQGKDGSMQAHEHITTGWQQGCDCQLRWKGDMEGDPGRPPVPCTVLDPFGGSGTVGVMAKKLGREYILLELNSDYASMAADRIVRVQPPLFYRNQNKWRYIMITDKIGSKVVVKSEMGALISGTLGAAAPDGTLFVTQDAICLDVDFASQLQSWEILPKREVWRGKGEIVEDPRGERPTPNTWDYYEEVSLDSINREGDK